MQHLDLAVWKGHGITSQDNVNERWVITANAGLLG